MLFNLAVWYLQKYLQGLNRHSLVISHDFYYYKKRDLDEERSIQKTRSLIK